MRYIYIYIYVFIYFKKKDSANDTIPFLLPTRILLPVTSKALPIIRAEGQHPMNVIPVDRLWRIFLAQLCSGGGSKS